MATPNIEELIERLHSAMDDNQFEDTNTALSDAATTLQSKAERIAMLESLNELAVKQAETLVKQRDTLRAQLAAIAATAPVAWLYDVDGKIHFHIRKLDFYHTNQYSEYVKGNPLFTHPMPAKPQDHEIRELVDRLTAIAKEYGQTQQLRERIAQEIRPFTFTKPAQDKSNNYLNGYCTGRTDLLKEQAAPQAQGVTELVDALEKLARLGNGEHYGNSDGNMIARDALYKYKGAKL